MAVSKRLRFEILKRDNHTCRYCGGTAPDAILTIDHVIPVSLGGSDDPSNLVAACKDCNAGKTSSNPDAPLVANVADDTFRFAEAIKAVAKQREVEASEVKKWFSRAWNMASGGLIDAYDEEHQLLARNCPLDVYTDIYSYPNVHLLKFPPKAANWVSTIQSLVAAGLERGHIERLIGVAMASQVRRDDKWRYFCGCAWRAVRQLHAAAADLIRASEGVG